MRRLLLLALTLGLAACASQSGGPMSEAPVERSTTAQMPMAEARTRAQAALTAAGFSASPTGSGLTATAHGPDAAIDCPRARVVDDQSGSANRSYLATPSSQRTDVTVAMTEAAGGTAVKIGVTGEATYRDRYRGTTFTRACTSTGRVEQRVLAAVQGGG